MNPVMLKSCHTMLSHPFLQKHNGKDPYSLPSARHSLQLENRILEIKLLETSSRPQKQAHLPELNPFTLRLAEWQRTFTHKRSHLPSLGILTINTLLKSTTLFRWYQKNKVQQPFISDGGQPWWPCAFYAMQRYKCADIEANEAEISAQRLLGLGCVSSWLTEQVYCSQSQWCALKQRWTSKWSSNFSTRCKTSTGFMSGSMPPIIFIISTILSKKRKELHIMPSTPVLWLTECSAAALDKLWNQWISATGPLELQDN